MRILHIINLSGHPLSSTVVDRLIAEGCTVETISVGVDLNQSLADQIRKLIDTVKSVPLDGSVPFAITLPGLSETTAFFLAEIHGRTGCFPKVIQIRSSELGTFEISDLSFPESLEPGVVDLERVRLKARSRRWKRKDQKTATKDE